MSADGQGTKWRRNIAENFNRLSRVHQRYRQTTDRQTTDRRQTDRRWHIANMNLSSRSLKIEFNANFDLYTRFPILQNMSESALKWKKMAQKNWSDSVFLNFISSFFRDFPRIIPRGFARYFYDRMHVVQADSRDVMPDQDSSLKYECHALYISRQSTRQLCN